MAIPSKDEMKARFWELKGVIEAAHDKIAPLREARDAAVNAHAEADEKAMADIRAIEAEVTPGLNMADAKAEMAFLARGLGNVGDDPSLAPAEAE
jgi:hypothetical protein